MPDGRPNLTVTRALMRLWFPGRLGLRGALGGFAIVLILLYGVFAACYPWDYSLTFGPTLTGTWLGELQDQKGHRRAALLDLERESSDRIWNNLTGTLRLCGAAERRAFNVTGDTRNWRGTRLWFETALDETGDGQGPQVSRAEASGTAGTRSGCPRR